MWIASSLGFYSIKRENKDTFYVRARVKKDLENLNTAAKLGLEVQSWPQADYRYRLIVDPTQLLNVFAVMVQSIVYDNFKDHIAKLPDQRNKLTAYHNIWNTMFGMQFENEHPRRGEDTRTSYFESLFEDSEEVDYYDFDSLPRLTHPQSVPRVSKKEKKQRKLAALKPKQKVKVIKRGQIRR